MSSYEGYIDQELERKAKRLRDSLSEASSIMKLSAEKFNGIGKIFDEMVIEIDKATEAYKVDKKTKEFHPKG